MPSIFCRVYITFFQPLIMSNSLINSREFLLNGSWVITKKPEKHNKWSGSSVLLIISKDSQAGLSRQSFLEERIVGGKHHLQDVQTKLFCAQRAHWAHWPLQPLSQIISLFPLCRLGEQGSLQHRSGCDRANGCSCLLLILVKIKAFSSGLGPLPHWKTCQLPMWGTTHWS